MVVVAIQRWNAGHARTSFPRGEAPDVVLTTTPPYFLAGAIGHGSVPAPTDAGVLPCLPCPALPSCPALPRAAARRRSSALLCAVCGRRGSVVGMAAERVRRTPT